MTRTSILMKRNISACGLVVFPQSGHTINGSLGAALVQSNGAGYLIIEADSWFKLGFWLLFKPAVNKD